MKAIKIFDEEFTSRNFNTSPLSIDTSDYPSDKFDYEATLVSISPTAGNDRWRFQFNSDTTANYRSYYMRGSGSSATAGVQDSDVGISLDDSFQSAEIGFIKLKITGSVGSERYLSALYGSQGAKVHKFSGYWKNTIDEINSITARTTSSDLADAHIIVYATPKATSQGGWEKIDGGSINQNASTPVTIASSLDGNRDVTYKLSISNFDTSTTSGNVYLQLNGDTASNYINQRLRNNSGSISSNNNTFQGIILPEPTNEDGVLNFIINAESGKKRLVLKSAALNVGDYEQDESAIWWNDSVSNLSSIEILSSQSNIVHFNWTLYRRMTPSSTDVLPWELVEKVDLVSVDLLNNPVTFSNLTGDNEFLYKWEFIGTAVTSSTLYIQPNSDASTSNYIRQQLVGQNSSVSAASVTTNSGIAFAVPQTAVCKASCILYPNAGQLRPSISNLYWGENTVTMSADWWENTGDEITSCAVSASNTNPVSGTLKLYKLK